MTEGAFLANTTSQNLFHHNNKSTHQSATNTIKDHQNGGTTAHMHIWMGSYGDTCQLFDMQICFVKSFSY